MPDVRRSNARGISCLHGEDCCEQGWAIQGVERERDHPPWAYTVGLTEYGLPELVATGLRLPRAAELLNGVTALHGAPTGAVPGRGV